MSTDPISHEMKLVAVAINGEHQSAITRDDLVAINTLQEVAVAVAAVVFPPTRERSVEEAQQLKARFVGMCLVTVTIEIV
ncbi:hypothetical protein [Nonomuraea basaltis]|uniref:hypothetical protein n=1 Tax=Nonomuraea basaltis TaxID=2495887 RepID=UPI00110C5DEA|nr:hypothetical protein [Nonomuraea basaltis]TMR89493.1 hypothetical protein EJK15_60455 [Nonomuraea basaltis]